MRYTFLKIKGTVTTSRGLLLHQRDCYYIRGIVTTSRGLLLHQGDCYYIKGYCYYIKGIVTTSRGLFLHQGDCYKNKRALRKKLEGGGQMLPLFFSISKINFHLLLYRRRFQYLLQISSYYHVFVFRLFESMAFRHGIRALYRASENPSDKLHRFNIKFFFRISSNILSYLNFFIQECKQCV